MKNITNNITDTLVNYFDEKVALIEMITSFERIINSHKDDHQFCDLKNITFDFWEKIYLYNLDDYGDFIIKDSSLVMFKTTLCDYLIASIKVINLENIYLYSNQEYLQEYKIFLNQILNNTITWNEIEESLMFWKDVIPDKLLENSLLNLKFIYVYKKAEEQLGLPFPGKLKKEIECVHELKISLHD
jgi:hypothetical protein